MFGRTDFPIVTERYYPLTLGPGSFFWFSLEQRSVPVEISAPKIETKQPRIPVVSVTALADVWEEATRHSIAATLPSFLLSRRWFPAKERRFRSVEIADVIRVAEEKMAILLVRTEYTTGDPDLFLVPVAAARGDRAQIVLEEHADSLIAELHAADGSRALLYSGTRSEEFCTALLDAFARRKRLHGDYGEVFAERNRQFRRLWGATHPGLEPTLLASAEVNTSIRFGDRFVMKLIRTVEPGPNPGVEFGQHLTQKLPEPFPNVPPFAGYLEYRPESGDSSNSYTLAILHGFVRMRGRHGNIRVSS